MRKLFQTPRLVDPQPNSMALRIIPRNAVSSNKPVASIRTVITALQKNLRILRESADLMSLEHEIVPVEEIFRLQGADELKESERRYLPAARGKPGDGEA